MNYFFKLFFNLSKKVLPSFRELDLVLFPTGRFSLVLLLVEAPSLVLAGLLRPPFSLSVSLAMPCCGVDEVAGGDKGELGVLGDWIVLFWMLELFGSSTFRELNRSPCVLSDKAFFHLADLPPPGVMGVLPPSVVGAAPLLPGEEGCCEGRKYKSLKMPEGSSPKLDDDFLLV